VTFGGAHQAQGTIDNAASERRVGRWPPPPPLLRKIRVGAGWCCAVLNERFNHACATAKEKALYLASSYLSVTQLSGRSKPLSKLKSRIELLFN
jgi:hypothetical protein